MDPAAAVCPPTLFPRGKHFLPEHDIPASSGRGRPLPPSVVAARRQAENTTHRPYRKVVCVGVHELERLPRVDSLAALKPSDGTCQYGPVKPKLFDLSFQAAMFGSLVCRDSVASAQLVELGLLDPRPNRRRRRLKLARQVLARPPRTCKLNDPPSVLQRILLANLRHRGHSFSGRLVSTNMGPFRFNEAPAW